MPNCSPDLEFDQIRDRDKHEIWYYELYMWYDSGLDTCHYHLDSLREAFKKKDKKSLIFLTSGGGGVKNFQNLTF